MSTQLCANGLHIDAYTGYSVSLTSSNSMVVDLVVFTWGA
jgi:hypothetical protein